MCFCPDIINAYIRVEEKQSKPTKIRKKNKKRLVAKEPAREKKSVKIMNGMRLEGRPGYCKDLPWRVGNMCM